MHNNSPEPEMGLDFISKKYITLSKCDGKLTLKKLEDTNLQGDIETYQLSSFFNILEDDKSNITKQGLSKITILNLSHCDLMELPRELKCLNLKVLNVSHNKLTIPPLCLYGNGLNKLETLDLSHNLITEFNLEPDCVTTLKKLMLNNNSFENIPAWFLTFRCIQLEELNYSDNQAKHYNFLNHFCNFSLMKLRKLEMRDSCLVDLDVIWLKCLKNLEVLDISNESLVLHRKCINKFKDLNELFKMSHWRDLQTLTLCHLDISIFPLGIFWIVTLTKLNVSNNLISWFPEGIEYLVKLEYLNVCNNELYVLPKEMCHLVNLKVLLLAHNLLSDVPELPRSLEVLDLYDNHLSCFDSSNYKTIKLKDLDDNFQEIEEHEYCTSRDQFRELYNHKNRLTGPKPLEELPQSRRSSSCSSSDFEENPSFDNVPISNLEEEDWDKECEEFIVRRHPNMSPSDDEYEGEQMRHCGLKSKSKSDVYISDEDWMYEDAD